MHTLKYGVVLQVIRTRVAIARVVGSDRKGIFRAATQLNPQAAVGVDLIADNPVGNAGDNGNAMTTVACNAVEAVGCEVPDGIARGIELDIDAFIVIAHAGSDGAGDIRADIIAPE